MSINNCDRCGRDLVDPEAQYGWRCERIMGGDAPSSFAKFLSDRYLTQYDIDPKHINLSKLFAATDKTMLSRLTNNEAMRREALLEAYTAMGFRQDEIDPNVFTSSGVRSSAVITLANWFNTIWDNLLDSLPSILPKSFASEKETNTGGSRGSHGSFGVPSSSAQPEPQPTDQRPLPSTSQMLPEWGLPIPPSPIPIPPSLIPVPTPTPLPSPTPTPTPMPVYATSTRRWLPTREQEIANAEYIFSFLKNEGWTTEAICGLLGNIQVESKFNPGARGTVGNPNSRYGLVQWTKPYTKFYKWSGLTAEGADYLAENNPRALIDLQLDSIIWSSQPSTHSDDRQWFQEKKATDHHAPYTMTFDEYVHSEEHADTLALMFFAHYERSDASKEEINNTRGKYALEWYDYFTKRENRR